MTDLIPIAYIQETCLLSDNIEQKKIRVALEMAQEDLEDIIKPEFYEEIETQYEANTLTADNNAFYDDYVKKYLAWQAYFNYLKFANVDTTPTGVREFNDENSSVVSDIKMYSFEKNVLERANRFKFRMINFLNEQQANDSDKYPLWENECKDVLSFAITAVDKNSDSLIRINKTINTNE